MARAGVLWAGRHNPREGGSGLRTTICTTVHVLESKSFECRDCEVVVFVRFAFQWFVQWLIVARSCAGPGSQFELVRASRLRRGGLIL